MPDLPALRATVQPIDTYKQHGADEQKFRNLSAFGNAVQKFSGTVSQLAFAAQDRANQEEAKSTIEDLDRRYAEVAATSKESFANMVRSGEISFGSNPWVRTMVKEQFGALRAQESHNEFMRQLADSNNPLYYASPEDVRAAHATFMATQADLIGFSLEDGGVASGWLAVMPGLRDEASAKVFEAQSVRTEANAQLQYKELLANYVNSLANGDPAESRNQFIENLRYMEQQSVSNGMSAAMVESDIMRTTSATVSELVSRGQAAQARAAYNAVLDWGMKNRRGDQASQWKAQMETVISNAENAAMRDNSARRKVLGEEQYLSTTSEYAARMDAAQNAAQRDDVLKWYQTKLADARMEGMPREVVNWMEQDADQYRQEVLRLGSEEWDAMDRPGSVGSYMAADLEFLAMTEGYTENFRTQLANSVGTVSPPTYTKILKMAQERSEGINAQVSSGLNTFKDMTLHTYHQSLMVTDEFSEFLKGAKDRRKRLEAKAESQRWFMNKANAIQANLLKQYDNPTSAQIADELSRAFYEEYLPRARETYPDLVSGFNPRPLDEQFQDVRFREQRQERGREMMREVEQAGEVATEQGEAAAITILGGGG